MPSRKCAIKDLRKAKSRRERNLVHKKKLKQEEKKIQAVLTAANPTEIKQQLRLFMKAVDQAAANNIIHKNRAAREKSRAMRKANTIEAGLATVI